MEITFEFDSIVRKAVGILGQPRLSWDSLYPALHRALANGESSQCRLSASDDLGSACSNWGALHYAMTCLLGWDDVGKGLARWYAAGRPTGDSTVLALVQAIWGGDDKLDCYAAWAWKLTDSMNRMSAAWLAEHSRWNDEDWWRAFLRRARLDQPNPFSGGTDPLHLSIHTGREDQRPSRSPILRLDEESRHGVLITEGIGSWLADLEAMQDTLPSLGPRSWHIEIFDRRTGYLGLFRRSQITGRWFTGKHSIHTMGFA